MLNRQALNQLQGLKQQIESEKEHAEAVVRATTGRFGFARLMDGRDVFLPPDEMLKVFPGDRVQVAVRPGKDKRPVAEIERLLHSDVAEFNGRCVRKGKALFVQPDLPNLTRWLFIPPKARNGAQEGDYLRCGLLRHPVHDGKPAAKVLERIGAADEAGIENRYVMARHGIKASWPDADLAAAEKLLENVDPLADERREDLSGLSFVSIDAARTQDIDDALYAEVTSEGWTLYVAIADPSAYIDGDSPLRERLRERASSVYFHGAVAPMLPESLAQHGCALAENELRPALVCRMDVSEDGNIGAFQFVEAKVCSGAKLSYYAVDRYLSGQNESLICHATPLEALYQASRALRTRREAEGLVMEERQEFRWILDEQGQIDHIEPCEKLQSQRLVEECMVAANRCAARFLAEHNASGPFVVHDGFRRDRLKDRTRFMERFVPELKDIDLDSLSGYRTLIKYLNSSEHDLPLRSMVNRLLSRARYAVRSGAHMGMSLEGYTNCTSPLRKYLDFLVHLQIKAVLAGREPKLCDQPELDALQKRQQQLRAATQEAERWLAHNYLEKLAQSEPGPWSGHVSYVDNKGVMVRLDANGLEGYVPLRSGGQGRKGDKGEKFHFDRDTATLKSKRHAFRVDTPVAVTLDGVDPDTPRLSLFRLTPESGLLKAEKIEKTEKAKQADIAETAEQDGQAETPPEVAATGSGVAESRESDGGAAEATAVDTSDAAVARGDDGGAVAASAATASAAELASPAESPESGEGKAP